MRSTLGQPRLPFSLDVSLEPSRILCIFKPDPCDLAVSNPFVDSHNLRIGQSGRPLSRDRRRCNPEILTEVAAKRRPREIVVSCEVHRPDSLTKTAYCDGPPDVDRHAVEVEGVDAEIF